MARTLWPSRVVVTASGFTITVGMLTLIGYAVGLRILVTMLPGSVPMAPDTAVMFVLLGEASWLASPVASGVRRRRIGQCLALLVALYGVVVLLEYVLGDLGIDRLLFAARVREWMVSGIPGRPSPHTAVAFVVTGLTVALLDSDAARRYRYARVLAPVAALVAGVGLAGRVFGLDYLFGSARVSGMSVGSAVTFMVLTSGLLACRPDRPPVRSFTSRGLGGVTIRRLTPVVATAVLLVGVLLASTNNGSTALTGFAVTAASAILVLTLLVVFARTGEMLDQVDREHRASITALRDENVARGLAETEYRQSTDQLTYFFNLSTDPMCIAGSDGYFKRLNPAWERIFGFTEAELTARPYGEFIHPDDVERTAAETTAQALEGKVSLSFENRYRCRDGSYRWLTWNAFPHEGWVYAVARDTTDQRRAIEEQSRLAAIVENTDDAVISKTLDGIITSWNAAAERIYGYSAEEAIGQPITIILDEDVDSILPRVAAGESVTDFRSVRHHKDGSTIYLALTVSPVRDPDGTIVAAASIARDVTAGRIAEERFRRLVQSAPDAMLIADPGGRIVLANEQAERMFGYPAAEMIGQRVEMLIPPRVRERHVSHRLGYVRDPALRRMGTGTELTGLRSDGTEFPVEISLAPLDTDQGSLVSASIRDATERVRIEGDLAAARDEAREATAAKSAFLATMSHEIRTPMNAVIGMTGLLLDTALDDEQREFTETVRTSGEALLALINNILDFSKIESGELDLEIQPFDVRDCVDSALALLALPASEKGLELVAQLEDSCPELVIGDVTRFRQVIVNLLANAVKFTADGEVVVTISGKRPTDQDAADGGVDLTVSVRDTGIGIPPERINRLFQPFSQVDSSTTRIYGGSGLGLVISRRLAQAMGGDLHVTSTTDVDTGTGSIFVFTARLQVSLDRRVADAHSPTVSLVGRSALIVDDNATNRRMLQLLLPTWGMTATPLACAADALRLLSPRTGPPPHFDVAVLDMRMPQMDGAQLAAALRLLPAGRDLPLILLTSMNWRPTPEQRTLFAAILTKPARSAVLREKLQGVLGPAQAVLGAIETAGGRRSGDGEPAAARPLRILVAEDNFVNQKVAQAMLTKLGHRADVVGNGVEAVQAVRLAPYDVVLMDVQMPELDGPEATRLIRAETLPAGQPFIVALTASVLPEDRHACQEAGMDEFLPKPIRLQDLQDLLAQLSGSQRTVSPSSS